MKKLLTTLLLSIVTIIVQAQVNENSYLEKVQTLDSTIETLYAVISGEKGEGRNWELMKFLFHPDAKLITTGKNKEGLYNARFMTSDAYIENNGNWLIENGFFEKEIHRTVNTFGSITQVFSTYESFHSESDSNPFMRGINSIQLLNDGNRWWIINIYWQQETEDNLIPDMYLPN